MPRPSCKAPAFVSIPCLLQSSDDGLLKLALCDEQVGERPNECLWICASSILQGADEPFDGGTVPRILLFKLVDAVSEEMCCREADEVCNTVGRCTGTNTNSHVRAEIWMWRQCSDC